MKRIFLIEGCKEWIVALHRHANIMKLNNISLKKFIRITELQ